MSSRRAALDEARARVSRRAMTRPVAAFADAEKQLATRPDLADIGDRLDGASANGRARPLDSRRCTGRSRGAEARGAKRAPRRLGRDRAPTQQLDATRRKRRRSDRRRSAAAARKRRPNSAASPTRPTRSTKSAARCCRSFRRPSCCARPPPTGCRRRRPANAMLDKAATAAIQALAETRKARARAEERLTAADRAPQGGRGAHPGSAEHTAASGHSPYRASARRPDACHRRGRAAARPVEDRARTARRGQSARRGGTEGAVASGSRPW